MKYGKNEQLLTGSIPKNLLLFSIPILLGNILQTLNGTINSIWVGKYLGESAFAATSNANIIMFFLFSFIFGIGMASTILVGKSIGAGDVKEAKKVTGTSASFFLFLSVIVTSFGLLFTKEILLFLQTPKDSLEYAMTYLKITFIGVPFMFGFTFLMMVLRGVGDAKTPFKFLIVSTIIDIFLNPVLILGIGIFPKMGIAGSATAGIVAQFIAFITLLGFIYLKKHFIRLEKHELSYLKINKEVIKKIITKGIPMSVQMIVVSSSSILLINLINTYGSSATAAFGASMQISSYVQMPAIAVGGAVSALAAINIGAKNWERVRKITLWGILYNLLLTGTIISIIYLFEKRAVGLFLKTDEVIELAVWMNAISVWSFLVFGLMSVLSSVMQASGSVMMPLLITVISLWGVRIPVAYYLGNAYGIEKVLWCIPFGFIIGFILVLIFYLSGKWKKTSM